MLPEGITVMPEEFRLVVQPEGLQIVSVAVQGPPGTAGPPGQGVPAGGASGYLLSKASATDYDTAWTVASTGGGGSSTTGTWKYRTGTTMADPGTGNYRFNALTVPAVTALALSRTNSDGIDSSIYLRSLIDGDGLYVQDKANGVNWARFILTGPVVDNGTWFQLPLALQEPTSAGGAMPNNATDCLLDFTRTVVTANVTTFNTREGDVVLLSSDVTDALGYTPSTGEDIDDRVAALLQAGSNVTLTYNDVAGTLTISAAGGGGGAAIGGAVTGGTAGSVLFLDAGGVLAQDNAQLHWDNVGNRLAIGTSSLTDPIVGDSKFKVVDGPMTLSFKDYSGAGWLAVSNGTVTGFVGNTHSLEGFVFGTQSAHGAVIRTGGNSVLRCDTALHVLIKPSLGGTLTGNANGCLHVIQNEPGMNVCTFQAAPAQSAPLQEWQDSAGAALARVGSNGLFFPVQAPTASAPAYVKGGVYFDLTLNKLRVGGASGWETVSSS